MDTTAKPLKPLDTWKKNPDPKSEPELAQQRIRQWRRYSRDPFESEKNGADASPKQGEGSNDKVPGPKPNNPRMTSWASGNTVVQTGPDKGSEIKHPELKHPGSSWVHLFYDLAWAASFASLTGSGKFDNPLDTVNYFMFFAAVLWLWTSHTLYSIHFYTNDWFHLISTFLQLFIFGMLAATTKGYDITNYIAHSPGMPKLRESNNMDDLDPQEYTEEMTAYLSMLVLAISFAATRIIQLVQYIRVLYYRGSTKPNPKNQNTTRRSWILRFRSWISRFRPWISRARFRRLPPQLIAITIGLLISSPMFIAALGIAASNFGETVLGASLKLGLWVGGFLIEVVSHLSMPIYWWMKNQDITTINASDRKKRMLPTAPDVKQYERLQTITTIILGEGINGIAGTLSTVLAAPGIGRTVAINIVSAACTIWFIAYIYFEGPKGETSPALTSLRYLLWMILHLPFLASTVLMLIGMKSQFLLTSFLSAFFGTTGGFNRILNEQLNGNNNATYWRTNPDMKRFLFKRGIVWEDEFYKYLNASMNATNTGEHSVMPVWSQRLSLTIALKLFKDFNGGDDSIPSDLQDTITTYYKNSTQVIEDLKIIPTHPKDAVYFQILGGLLDGFVLSTRCVIGFAGLILISLGLQDLIHSRPSDRYQWGVITSRISMGLILCLLLLLNIGKYQDLFVTADKLNQRAGVFQWLEAFWVLPTIAIAYGLEYLVEMALAMSAKRVTVETHRRTREQERQGSSHSNNNDSQESQEDPEKQQMA